MPTIIATLKLKADNLDEAKGFLRELAAETLANEPGTLTYVVHERKDDPTTVVVYEKYESDEAFKEHGKNLASKGARFGKFLDGPLEIVALEEI
jgi:quinol monooxygenase YgiN